MTKREFYEAVLEITEDKDLVEFAEKEVARLEAQRIKRAAQTVDAKEARIEFAKVFAENFGDESMTATDAMRAFGDQIPVPEGKELTVQRVSHILRTGVEAGALKALYVKGPKGPVRGYVRVKEEA